MPDNSANVSGPRGDQKNAGKGSGGPDRMWLRPNAKHLSTAEIGKGRRRHRQHPDTRPARQRQSIRSSSTTLLATRHRADEAQAAAKVLRRCDQKHSAHNGRQAHDHRWLQRFLQDSGMRSSDARQVFIQIRVFFRTPSRRSITESSMVTLDPMPLRMRTRTSTITLPSTRNTRRTSRPPCAKRFSSPTSHS